MAQIRWLKNQEIYTSRLNYSGLPKPKNEKNFEKELEELTKSTSAALSVAVANKHEEATEYKDTSNYEDKAKKQEQDKRLQTCKSPPPTHIGPRGQGHFSR
ncbi:hypothetical protein Glove_642g28 [Diversispora epigaea]|uniref:Uncharacterized protein n=1 Tax=Diversispora epigaea TaxID=1348612 RepID=A0A397G7C6_9GLOM|nr:hypothetical protein Glove_642g28 [Diversispora epigaea]